MTIWDEQQLACVVSPQLALFTACACLLSAFESIRLTLWNLDVREPFGRLFLWFIVESVVEFLVFCEVNDDFDGHDELKSNVYCCLLTFRQWQDVSAARPSSQRSIHPTDMVVTSSAGALSTALLPPGTSKPFFLTRNVLHDVLHRRDYL